MLTANDAFANTRDDLQSLLNSSRGTPRILFAFDLDGTLLGRDGDLMPGIARVLQELNSAGACLTWATGRSPGEIPACLTELPFFGERCYFDGALVGGTDHEFCKHLLDPLVIDNIIREISVFDISVFATSETGGKRRMRLLQSRGADMNYYRRRTGKVWQWLNPADDSSQSNLIAISFLGREEDLNTAMNHLEEFKHERGLDWSAHFYRQAYPLLGHAIVELRNPRATKGHAVQSMRRRFGFDSVVAFGDHYNDRSLFANADLSIVMDSAPDEVKGVGDHVLAQARLGELLNVVVRGG